MPPPTLAPSAATRFRPSPSRRSSGAWRNGRASAKLPILLRTLSLFTVSRSALPDRRDTVSKTDHAETVSSVRLLEPTTDSSGQEPRQGRRFPAPPVALETRAVAGIGDRQPGPGSRQGDVEQAQLLVELGGGLHGSI